MASTLAAVALGSNVGDRRAHLLAAVEAASRLPATRVVAVSSFRDTAPVGPVPQGDFLNAAMLLETALEPRALLEALHCIERSRGRCREAEVRWGPRTLDLDLLIHGSSVIQDAGLILPHPRLHERGFVLEPLEEIAPDLPVPGSGRSVRALAETWRRAAATS
ncbi:MAG: 2-amino-4-hydroxy-6-hydroxymethyldihydropteridine diphosphokinase [Phycisphaerae bacterium]|jgi:2-amino-4-hydroxy-6-hydroxymethyldihydropteridine diphosphokinase